MRLNLEEQELELIIKALKKDLQETEIAAADIKFDLGVLICKLELFLEDPNLPAELEENTIFINNLNSQFD